MKFATGGKSLGLRRARGGRSAGSRAAQVGSARRGRAGASRPGSGAVGPGPSWISGRLRLLLRPRTVLVLLAVWAVYEGFLSGHSVLNLYRFKQERNELRRQLAEAEARRDELKRRLELLETDPFTLEKLAREEMGLARPGEIVYRYEEPAAESKPQGPLTPPIVDEAQAGQANEKQ